MRKIWFKFKKRRLACTHDIWAPLVPVPSTDRKSRFCKVRPMPMNSAYPRMTSFSHLNGLKCKKNVIYCCTAPSFFSNFSEKHCFFIKKRPIFCKNLPFFPVKYYTFSYVLPTASTHPPAPRNCPFRGHPEFQVLQGYYLQVYKPRRFQLLRFVATWIWLHLSTHFCTLFPSPSRSNFRQFSANLHFLSA